MLIGSAIQKTHQYRAKRATQHKETHRQLKWGALVKRARKAATAGRVNIFVFSFFPWVSELTQWVVGSNNQDGMESRMNETAPTKAICRIGNKSQLERVTLNVMKLFARVVSRGKVCGCDPQAHSLLRLKALAATAPRDTLAFGLGPRGKLGPAAPRATLAFGLRPIGNLGLTKGTEIVPWERAAFIYEPLRLKRWVNMGPIYGATTNENQSTRGRPQRRKNTAWGRALAAWMLMTWAGQWNSARHKTSGQATGRRTSGFLTWRKGEEWTDLPTLRAGGGVSNSNVRKRGLFAINQSDLAPVTQGVGKLVRGGSCEVRRQDGGREHWRKCCHLDEA